METGVEAFIEGLIIAKKEEGPCRLEPTGAF
jgi:hypothetical protein